jgi:hypothetical protein
VGLHPFDADQAPGWKRAGAALVALGLSACGGGGSSGGTGVSIPPPIGVVSDDTARAVAQSALLAEQAAIVLAVPSGDPVVFGRLRRPASRTPRATSACNGGTSEVDTAGTDGNVHVVISLYFDAACTSLRQTATFDRNFGLGGSNSTGTIVSYDAAGNVTAVESVTDFTFTDTGNYASRQWTDAAGASAPLFGHASLSCTQNGATCTLAAVTDGPSFQTGVVLDATLPSAAPTAGSSVTVPFSGSLSTAAPGTITLTQPAFAAPTLAGGTPLATLTGSLTFAPGADGPTTFSLSLDSDGVHVAGTYASGTTTFALSSGMTVTVNANGDGTIRYASGASGNVVDFRIIG